MTREPLAAVACVLVLGACSSGGATTATSSLTPSAMPTSAISASPSRDGSTTLTCTGKTTPAVTEGPYFKAGSPERTNLYENGMSGTRLSLGGTVFGPDCKPAAGAMLDFWQADAVGAYDNSGYRLRGHQSSDAAGRYHLDTVIPGLYPGRTEHIHVKVQRSGAPVLTTQLFFPGVARNQQDSIYSDALLMGLTDGAAGKTGAFDFVVPT